MISYEENLFEATYTYQRLLLSETCPHKNRRLSRELHKREDEIDAKDLRARFQQWVTANKERWKA